MNKKQNVATLLTMILVLISGLLFCRIRGEFLRADSLCSKEARWIEMALTTPDDLPALPAGEPLLRFLQITDTHHRREDMDLTTLDANETRLLDLIDFCNEELKPDFVVHTGDLVHPGEGRQLRRFAAFMNRLSCPWIPVCGNHDGPDFTDCFGEVNWSFTYRGVHFVVFPVLDTFRLETFSFRTAMDWFESDLQRQKNLPKVVFCHDPVFVWGDLGRNHRIMEKVEGVAVVLSGHLHTDLSLELGGIRHITTWRFDRKPHRVRCCDVYAQGIWMVSYEYERETREFVQRGPNYFVPFSSPMKGKRSRGAGHGT